MRKTGENRFFTDKSRRYDNLPESRQTSQKHDILDSGLARTLLF